MTTTTQNYNIEVQQGATILESFSCIDSSTGFPIDITKSFVEFSIKFDGLTDPLKFNTSSGNYITLVGSKGIISVSIPWLNIFNSNLGSATYTVYVTYPSGYKYLNSKGLFTIVATSYSPSVDSNATYNNPFMGLIKKVSSNYAISGSDSTVLVDASTGPLSVTLQPLTDAYASGVGKVFNIKRLDATTNTVTVVGHVDGFDNVTLSGKNSSIQLQAFYDGYYSISYSGFVSGSGSGSNSGSGQTSNFDYAYIATIT